MNSSYIPLSYAQGHRRSNISLPPYERFLHLQLAVFQKKNKQLHCQIVLYTKSSSLTSPANGKSKDGKQGNRAVRQTFFSNLNGLSDKAIIFMLGGDIDSPSDGKYASPQNLLFTY